MEFFKGLTRRQWLIFFFTIIFIMAAYLTFYKKTLKSKIGPDLETLRRQSTAPRNVDESLNRSEVEALLKQGRVAPTAEQARNTLTDEQKKALLKLMSVPRK